MTYGRGSISLSMLLVTVFQGFYVWDALYMEKVGTSPLSAPHLLMHISL